MRTMLSQRRWLLVAVVAAVLGAPAAADAQISGDPFVGNGVWIWHVARTEDGDPLAIAARARAANISTVIVKAAHGPVAWRQFSGPLIAALKAQGLRVCAYQRLLGRRPGLEAAVAVGAIHAGADCFVIDAEAELEGRYAAARPYLTALRTAVGAAYPIALTSFPYADLHQRFPYSVFLGPGGAQVDMPQIYWNALATPVAAAFARTYPYNRIYARPIRPLGQLWQGPPAAQVLAFRRLANVYGAQGLSWWNWEQARPGLWPTLAVPVVGGMRVPPAYPTLRLGAHGDAGIWAKARMRRLGAAPTPGGVFDGATRQALLALQSDAGLQPTGRLDPPTWSYLLADIVSSSAPRARRAAP